MRHALHVGGSHGPMTGADETVRTLRTVTVALVGSMISLIAIAVFVRPQVGDSIEPAVTNLLLGAAGLLVVTGVVAYQAILRQTKAEFGRAAAKAAASADPLAPVLAPYRRACILRGALTEAPGLLGALAYMVGANAAGLLITGASAVFLLAGMPSREKLERFAESLRE